MTDFKQCSQKIDFNVFIQRKSLGWLNIFFLQFRQIFTPLRHWWMCFCMCVMRMRDVLRFLPPGWREETNEANIESTVFFSLFQLLVYLFAMIFFCYDNDDDIIECVYVAVMDSTFKVFACFSGVMFFLFFLLTRGLFCVSHWIFATY